MYERNFIKIISSTSGVSEKDCLKVVKAFGDVSKEILIKNLVSTVNNSDIKNPLKAWIEIILNSVVDNALKRNASK